jgi:hypothetical protein
MQIPHSFALTSALVVAFLTPLQAKSGGVANAGADVGVGVTTNTTNQLISLPGGGGRGPVAPAYSPSPGAGSSLGHPGESRVRLQTQNVCGVYYSNGKLKDVIVLNSSVEVAEPSAVRQRGASFGLSLFNVGVSGGVSSGDVTPSNPHPKSGEYLLELEASQIVSCEAVGNHHLRQERVEESIRTLQILRRGRLQGMAYSESAKGDYERARRQVGLKHPDLPKASDAARKGKYEEAVKLLSKPTTPSPPVRGLW